MVVADEVLVSEPEKRQEAPPKILIYNSFAVVLAQTERKQYSCRTGVSHTFCGIPERTLGSLP